MLQYKASFRKLTDSVKKLISDNDNKKYKIPEETLIQKAFQDAYDNAVASLMNSRGSLADQNGNPIEGISYYGRYHRYVCFMGYMVQLIVTRVILRDGSTHAILPDFMIPFSHYLVQDYEAALEDDASEYPQQSAFDRGYFKSRATAFFSRYHIPDNVSSSSARVSYCFASHARQFMQFSHLSNRLLPNFH